MAEGLEHAARLVKDEWIFPFVIHGTAAECAAAIADLCDRHGFAEFTAPVLDRAAAEETMATAAEIIELVGALDR